MSIRAWPVLLLCFVCEAALADTLVMKSGENKKGKIIEETEKAVLFNSQEDGAVIEVPKASIAIVDRDLQSGTPPPKGSVQIFSTPPKKKKNKILWELENPPAEKPSLAASSDGPAPVAPKIDMGGQEKNFQSFMKLIEDWVRNHPEAEKYIQEWMKKFAGNQGEVEKLIKVADEA
jgi:hypothetical protein